MSLFDSRNPANGVHVAPMVKGGWEKVNGLSMGQARAARHNRGAHVPEHLKGGAFVQPSGTKALRTISGTRSPFEYKRAGQGCYRTPGRKGPSSPVKKKVNSVFRGKVAKPHAVHAMDEATYRRQEASAFKRIKRAHAGLVGAGARGDEKHYEELRLAYLAEWPDKERTLNEIEAIHRKTIVPGVMGRVPMDKGWDVRQARAGQVAKHYEGVRKAKQQTCEKTARGEKLLGDLCAFHSKMVMAKPLVQTAGSLKLGLHEAVVAKYQRARAIFIKAYPELRGRLAMAEVAHNEARAA